MKAKSIKLQVIMALAVAVVLVAATVAVAGEPLRYSCSAQIYEAFGKDRLEAFTKETGVEVSLYVSSSGSALYRMMNDFSDLAGTTRGLYYRYKESGYVEIPFARDPIAVIASAGCDVKNLSRQQLRSIFSKEVSNWKEVGGADLPITVIVPGNETAAYKNFDGAAMERQEILYDFMTYKSTSAIEAVERFPGAISFITNGAVSENANICVVSVDGVMPRDEKYPFYQTFYYVTKGEPTGAVRQFIDFTLSEKGIAIMKSKGIIPIVEK